MLVSIIWMIGGGFIGGQCARRLGAPPLMGMILMGIVLGPELGDRLSADLLALAAPLRTLAVMVILMRAGLGLDRDKLQQQGSVALRLGCLPALCEAIAVMVAAIWLFQFDWRTGLLLGCIVGAESPAVIVPGMLRLKRLGWGVAKGIPDVILTSSALSDVLILLLFSLLMNVLTQEFDGAAVQLLPFQVMVQVIVGGLLGYGAARLIVWLLVRQRLAQNTVQTVIVVAIMALGLVAIAQQWPYFSGYLAVMALGFFILEQDPPLARQLRIEFNNLWTIAEIILFVLMGASIQLSVLEDSWLPGIGLLAIGLLMGRMAGWWLSTLGSNWSWKERLFLLPGNSAKATVQAAIGAIPLSAGVKGGEIILAIAALSILITAPVGAWAIQVFAPKLLQNNPVDPTKVTVSADTTLLSVINASSLATTIISQSASLARRCNGKVIVLYVINDSKLKQDGISMTTELTRLQTLLMDIRHQFIATGEPLFSEVQRVCEEYNVTEIIMGQADYKLWQIILEQLSSQQTTVVRDIPILVIDNV
ncbi:MAG: cation:proton antiporter [Cyanobacteria bacterium P01_F01_bin.150]